MGSGDEPVWAASIDAALAGTGPGMFWVDAVCVTPSHRQRGKGRGLIDAALRVYAAFVKESPESPWEG